MPLPAPLYALTFAAGEGFQLRLAAAIPADDPRIVETFAELVGPYSATVALENYRAGAATVAS